MDYPTRGFGSLAPQEPGGSLVGIGCSLFVVGLQVKGLSRREGELGLSGPFPCGLLSSLILFSLYPLCPFQKGSDISSLFEPSSFTLPPDASPSFVRLHPLACVMPSVRTDSTLNEKALNIRCIYKTESFLLLTSVT